MENKILIAITLEDLINILDNNLKDNNSIKILKEIIDKKYHYGVMQEKENTDLALIREMAINIKKIAIGL